MVSPQGIQVLCSPLIPLELRGGHPSTLILDLVFLPLRPGFSVPKRPKSSSSPWFSLQWRDPAQMLCFRSNLRSARSPIWKPGSASALSPQHVVIQAGSPWFPPLTTRISG